MRSDIDARRLALPIAAAVVALSLATAPMASAQTTITVTTTNDTNAVNPAVSPMDSSGNISLRSALENVNTVPPEGGAMIDLPSGTYTLTTDGGAGQGTAGALVLSSGVPVTILDSGTSPAIIDANYLDRALQISSGTVTLSGLTLEHGRSGALAGNTATTCPTGLVGAAATGGAIFDQGTLTLTADTFTNNMSDGNGGAVEDAGGLLTVTGSMFTANNACQTASESLSGFGVGGAVDESGGHDVTIDSSVISGNAAQGDGGGLAESGNVVGLTETVTNSTISNNHASSDGGGVAGEGGGTISLFADTLTGNTATSDGGGVGGNDKDQVTDSTITGNFAGCSTVAAQCTDSGSGIGGGIENAGAAVTISFSTINDNNAEGGNGGNLANGDSATYALDDSIVTGGIADDSPQNCSGQAFTSNGHNLFDDNGSDCATTVLSSDETNKNPKLGPLANNGGPTQTEALQNGSPAIDAASTSRCQTETKSPTAATPAPVDQRGIGRPQGAGCDIGAFETTPDAGVTGSVGQGQIFTGQQDTITWTVGNSGGTEAENTTFTDPGAGYTIDSVTVSPPATCTHTTTTVSCDLKGIPKGGMVTIKVVITGTTPGTITLNGRAATTGTDLHQANNHATVRITVKQRKHHHKPPPPPKPPRPTITLRRLGAGCYAQGATLRLLATARARAGIKQVSIAVTGPGSSRGVAVAPPAHTKVRHQKVGMAVRIATLLAGRTYHVVAIVTDKLGRKARVAGHFSTCNTHVGRGFTG